MWLRRLIDGRPLLRPLPPPPVWVYAPGYTVYDGPGMGGTLGMLLNCDVQFVSYSGMSRSSDSGLDSSYSSSEDDSIHTDTCDSEDSGLADF